MKNDVMAASLYLACFSIFSSYSFSQTIISDTTLANHYYLLANKYIDFDIWYEKNAKFDSAFFYAKKGQALYLKYFGEKSSYNAEFLYLLGELYYNSNNYNLALENYSEALRIDKEIHGEKYLDLAADYLQIGHVYDEKSAYDSALEYGFKSLQIALDYNLPSSQVNKVIFEVKHRNVAAAYNYIGKVYLNKDEYGKALEYNRKALQVFKVISGDWSPEVTSTYNNIGLVYKNKGEFDSALVYHNKALVAALGHNVNTSWSDKEVVLGTDLDIAECYSYIGLVHEMKREYDEALDFHSQSLKIDKEMHGENNQYVANDYCNIGSVHNDKGEYDTAFVYYNKALQIYTAIFEEEHPNVATVYDYIGTVYKNKDEYDKALEYYKKALQIRKVNQRGKPVSIATSYGNIGRIYTIKGELDTALAYHLKALKISKEILGDKDLQVAKIYNDLGNVYSKKNRLLPALNFYSISSDIYEKILGKNNQFADLDYFNFGQTSFNLKLYDNALYYFFKALKISKETLGEKHPYVAQIYNKIGLVYYVKDRYGDALNYYQKGVSSCLIDFNDTIDVYKAPIIRGFLDWDELLLSLNAKAKIITDKRMIIPSLSHSERKEIALKHYEACDTLIDITRKKISTQSDKLALGIKASQVYKEAIELLTPVQPDNDADIMKNITDKDADLVFYFSEKNKSSVLLEALARQEIEKYAGIPDKLLQKEHNLNSDIAFYTKKLAEPEKLNSVQIALCQDKLFHINRSYDSLIIVFEKQFPKYYNLKYNTKTATVKDIQKLLDTKTALISYSVGDSTITSFTLTKSNMLVLKTNKIANLNNSIALFRSGLTDPSMLENYQRLGYKLYQQLFPKNALIDKQIEKLIIIPDGVLTIIPFESLLTENFTGDISYKEYPYLIKRYNISYSYSANLLYLKFSKEPSSTFELTPFNDWLAFAPVFDNKGSNIDPLPLTEKETEDIRQLFNEPPPKANVLLRESANEHFVKSGELVKYKILHFATHGYANEKPELSYLQLAQDTTGGEDGLLYSGEIYGLKLNADLVVLSACETGLGKIQEGEGLIGLTRALLYAGTKNIIVSLWEVASVSTAPLMVDFYKNLLASKEQVSYSEALRKAKLKMINEKTYAHPLFWSPFILIGK